MIIPDKKHDRVRPAISVRVFAFAIVAALGLAAVGVAAGESPATAPTGSATVQTECPVMVGEKIDPGVSVVFRGKTVYFCCQFCKSKFGMDPETYLPRLPQFGGAGSFSAASLIEPTGITTLSLVALTVCLGVLRRVRGFKPGRMLTIHKTGGVCALIAGAAHATLVLLAH